MKPARPPHEPKFAALGLALIGGTVTVASALWAWQQNLPALAAVAAAAALAIMLWRDICLFKPTALTLYLLFSVLFYSHRYLFKWGDPDTQTFREQAPDWLRASKDFVWLCFLFYVVVIVLTRRRRPQYRTSPLLIIAIGSYIFSALLSFWVYGGLNQPDLLDYLRRPLEYLPAILLAAVFVQTPRELHDLAQSAYALCYLVLAFLLYEAATGADNGFNWGGYVKRYGSIFGSPNDLGVVCVFVLTFTFSLWKYLLLPNWKKWFFACSFALALIGTVSLAAFLAIVVVVLVLFALHSSRLQSAIALTVLATALILAWQTDTVVYLIDRSTSVWKGTEGSVLSRAYLRDTFEAQIRHMDFSEYLLGMKEPLPIEDYYTRTFSKQGIIGLVSLLFLQFTLLSIHVKVWKAETEPKMKSIYLACTISTVGFFIEMLAHPRLDIFPTNCYFWLIAGLPLVKWPTPVPQMHRDHSKNTFVDLAGGCTDWERRKT